MKGALDVVLRHCSSLLDGSPLTEKEKKVFEGISIDFGRRGLRGRILLSILCMVVIMEYMQQVLRTSAYCS